MKLIVNSFIIAFSMYSKIPMPRAEWKEENMKYVMCFFPLIGAVIGGLVFAWSLVFSILPISRVLYAAVVVLIPLVITGGIHMDGFLDTVDARSSYQPPQKRLEILKDPHAGAFAIIACCGYYLLAFGVWYDIKSASVPLLAFTFVLSRALSGLAVVTFPLAKDSGLAATFSNQAKKRLTRRVMYLYLAICAAAVLMIQPIFGLLILFSAAAVFLFYRRMAIREFGGITGDLAGWFLQVCELSMAACVMLGGVICG